MTTSPHFSGHGTAETNGDGRNTIVDVKAHSPERRRPPPRTADGGLHALPALIMLDRLPIPMLATRLDGVVVYTNPAFAAMLGHPDTLTLTGQKLPALLAGHSATPPSECVTALRADRTVVVDWLHAEGFPVRSVISDTVFVRATDQILLIGVTDITELMWTNPPEPG
jgi:PAS domain-containing protein